MVYRLWISVYDEENGQSLNKEPKYAIVSSRRYMQEWNDVSFRKAANNTHKKK